MSGRMENNNQGGFNRRSVPDFFKNNSEPIKKNNQQGFTNNGSGSNRNNHRNTSDNVNPNNNMKPSSSNSNNTSTNNYQQKTHYKNNNYKGNVHQNSEQNDNYQRKQYKHYNKQQVNHQNQTENRHSSNIKQTLDTHSNEPFGGGSDQQLEPTYNRQNKYTRQPYKKQVYAKQPISTSESVSMVNSSTFGSQSSTSTITSNTSDLSHYSTHPELNKKIRSELSNKQQESKAKQSGVGGTLSYTSQLFYPSYMYTSNASNSNNNSYMPTVLEGCHYYVPPTFYQVPTSPVETQKKEVTKTLPSPSKRKKREIENDSSSEDEDDESISSVGSQIQLSFEDDDYIVGFASFNGSFFFCWQKATKESESQAKIRDILTLSSKYSGSKPETLFSKCIKNKSIYAALKKFIKKLIKQNQPFNPYLINSHSSLLMKLFLTSSNTWLEFASNLPAISNKFAKLKAREVKLLLSEYSTEWNYFSDIDLTKEENITSLITGDENELVKKFMKRVEREDFSKFKRRSHLLTCSWVCKCPNGNEDVFKELLKTIRTVQPTLSSSQEKLNQIFEREKNDTKPQKMTICELVAKVDDFDADLTNFKLKKPETSIFSERRVVDSDFSETFIKELSIIVSLNIFQELKYKYDFSHKKQKGAANDFKKLYSIVDVETQKKKTAFNAKIQSAYKDESSQISTLELEEHEKLIHQLIQFVTYDKEYRCFQRYYDLLKTEEDDINRMFGWFQFPYQLKAVQWLKRLNANINWVDIYLNRIHASPHFEEDILKMIDEECDRSCNWANESRYSFLDYSDKTFTIDKKGTKDCDDAFTILDHNTNSIKIAVHITDVASTILRNIDFSKNVPPVEEKKDANKRYTGNKSKFNDHPIFQSALFSEAARRIMSIYIPGVEETYAPCFPRHLSEELLSLIDKRPKEVISHIFIIYNNGKVECKGVVKGLIQVNHSYFFEEADEKIDSPYADPFWKHLYDCCCAIHEERLAHGAKKFTPGVVPLGGVDLSLDYQDDSPNPEIHVNTHRQNPSKSSKIITEFSILLNSTMAKYFYDNKICGLYKEFYQTYNRLLPESIKDMDIEEFVEVASILDPEGNETNYLAQGKTQQNENYTALQNFEKELKNQGSRKTTNIGKITTKPTKFYQNIIGVELYMQLSSPLRRWLDLVLQVQLVHHLNTIEAGIPWKGLESSLFSEEILHYWSEKVSDKIETVKDMEKQVMYHYFLLYLKKNMDALKGPYLLDCVSEINFRKGKRTNHPKHKHNIDYDNLVNKSKPVITQLLRLRLVNYNYFAIEAYVTSNMVDMDEITLVKVVDIDCYTHTISAELVQ
ncbi:predicted protein [Naegleria gruberi]|uniref:Predicted protein n=1 Tax=Naegleria gruberi TaxID=5762 RepID=D2VRH1_NAEGR|nr:uncharacterized protein NAEGRDRAFT_51679 [Naegleria gruberi]EFC40603.1 predicted protein [Naegleria gruberi]|eukprot:XP_002673347.1 predicted protein [Naegleria gruberi strain NEG-M]